MGELSALQPTAVFRHFEEICKIPHGSGNVSALVDHCIAFAEAHGLAWERDQADNLIIRKPASPGYEGADGLILQGHTDMVCEKVAGLPFDFEKDGIQPYADGDWLRARGTTLGADNGIAVAMCLALLEDDTLEHPPLEVLLTSDEEIGMIGAFAFDCSRLQGHKLINLDSEYEGVLMCSCAGGATVRSTLPVEREPKALQQIKLDITGLKSGHSGVEIDKGRANANVLMGRLLDALAHKGDYRLIQLSGGPRETAIACEAHAVLGVAATEAEPLLAEVKRMAAVYQKEYATTEPGLTVDAVSEAAGECEVLTADSTRRVRQLLLALPDGVQVMSPDMPGLVQTSLNFGTLLLEDTQLCMAHSVRSSITTQKQWIVSQVQATVALAGGASEVAGDYPGWSYNPHSVVKDTILKAYQELFGLEAKVDAVHAGIECGLFADSIEGLDCVSIGPELADVHTPKEKLSIPSVQRTYQLMQAVLKASGPA